MKKEFNLDDPLENLIIRFLNGQLSVDETDKLNSWIEESPENLVVFRTYQNIWLGSSALLPDERYNPCNSWKRVAKQMEKSANRRIYKSTKASSYIYMGLSKIAALIAAVFIIGALGSYFVFINYYGASGEIYTEISVPQGSRSQIVLPDNSRVWLNAGSRIKYPNDFNRTDRIVQLEGEAYFDVVSNPRKPFVVFTEHLRLRALGTAFNIKAYPEDEVVSATLVKGNVIVEIPDIIDQLTDRYLIILSPGRISPTILQREVLGVLK
jgi:transmembrane sensor